MSTCLVYGWRQMVCAKCGGFLRSVSRILYIVLFSTCRPTSAACLLRSIRRLILLPSYCRDMPKLIKPTVIAYRRRGSATLPRVCKRFTSLKLNLTLILIPRLHDTTSCQTDWTTGWMFVYTMQPVVQPVWRPVVRGLTLTRILILTLLTLLTLLYLNFCVRVADPGRG